MRSAPKFLSILQTLFPWKGPMHADFPGSPFERAQSPYPSARCIPCATPGWSAPTTLTASGASDRPAKTPAAKGGKSASTPAHTPNTWPSPQAHYAPASTSTFFPSTKSTPPLPRLAQRLTPQLNLLPSRPGSAFCLERDVPSLRSPASARSSLNWANAISQTPAPPFLDGSIPST